MKGKLLLLSCASVAAMSVSGQQLRADYIEWPNSSQFPDYVKAWVPGQPLFEDENFFISRVKPHATFRNSSTQIDKTITEENDKKLVYWVPVGYSNWDGVHTDALPNGLFDSEVFSTWSYVTHYGDWTSPQGWVPGGFADVAHKNGVAVSGVASIPFGSINAEWNDALTAMGKLDKEKTAQFLLYHGVDGLGYNSEFSGNAGMLANVRALHAYLYQWMADKNPLFENIWYDGTNDNGSITFDRGLGSHNQNTFGDSENKASSLFLNYNWNSASTISNSEAKAKAMGRSTYDLYAGHNMQGGEPRGGKSWQLLKDCGYSIGLWGAHSSNMIWQNRNTKGSSPDAMQRTYQTNIERWFSNGKRNPIADLPIYEETSFAPSETWFGMSEYMSARSSLKWDLSDEPFYSYFNLGNGKFFNWFGERQHDNEWYNISVQDYMPTWRYWFASEYLGTTADKMVENGLQAEFTWDDAWVGGSSLRIYGSTADEYLHLFKTSFQIKSGDVITVRYKLLNGKANINLCVSAEGTETTLIRENNLKVLQVTDEGDDEVWVEKTFRVSGQLASLNNKTIAMIALHFSDAENLDLRLGEISLVRKAAPAPSAPEITVAKLLANNFNGVDAKVIFKMPNSRPAVDPVYNVDVKTSMFKIYTQQEGEEAHLNGITTSWAALAFAAPVNMDGAQRMRVGVAAVSLDTKSDSEIAWSDYIDLPDYVVNEEVACNKSAIKPGEPFEISFVDPTHPGVEWALYDQEGNKIASASDTNIFAFENGIDEIGGYDVVINEGKADERRLTFFIQITAWERGALPEIQTLTVETKEGVTTEGVTIAKLENATLSYTGRAADGETSRGVKLAEKLFGVSVAEILSQNGGPGLEAYKSFSVGAWLKLDNLNKGTYSLLRIENRAGNWPKNNWGYFWSDVNEQGYIATELIDGAFGGSLDSNSEGMRLYADYSDSRIVPNGWTHVMFVFDYNDSKQLSYELYINGKRQTSKRWMHIMKSAREGAVNNAGTNWADFEAGLSSATAYGDNEEKTGYCSDNYPLSVNDWISFGGTSQNIGAMNAAIDDFQIWDKAVTAEDVAVSMNGIDPENLPEGLLAYWDMESDEEFDDETRAFLSKGKIQGAAAGWYELVQQPNEGAAKQTLQLPEFTSGCPFIPGTGYEVKTLPTWSGRRALISEANGSDTEGSAKVSYSYEGDYTVTLKLENSLGSHSMTYPVIKVSDDNAIEGVAADVNTVYAVGKTVFAGFAESGEYTVAIYNVAGERVVARNVNVVAGELVVVNLDTPAVYVVAIEKAGKPVSTTKVVVR